MLEPFRRWDGPVRRNGELLALASGKFDIFLTADRNLSYQQDVSEFDIAVVVVVAASNTSTNCDPLCLRYSKFSLPPVSAQSR